MPGDGVHGIHREGEVHVLGITELLTENADAVKGMLQRLIARGLRYDHGLLLVVDGATGTSGKMWQERSVARRSRKPSKQP